MKICKTAFAETLAKVHISDVFKRNGFTIKRDGSEDRLVSNKIKALFLDEMEEFCSYLLSKPHPNTLKKLEEVMIQPDSVKCKLLVEVIDRIPPERL